MASNAPVHNTQVYVAGVHRFMNVGTGSSTVPVGTLVALEKKEVMRIVSCNIGIGTTLPRGALDVVGNVYMSQNLGIGTTIASSYSLSVEGGVYSSGIMVSPGFYGQLYGVANAVEVASNALGLSGTPDITVGTLNANSLIGPLAGVANAAIVASNAPSLTGTPNITTGTISCTTISGGSATLSGTLTTSNLTVLGSNTIVNTYTTQSSNFSVCNIIGTGPAISVYQKGIGPGYPIVDFYDIDVSTTVPSLRIADGGNVGIGTASPIVPLHVQGNVYTSGSIGIGTTIARQRLDVIGDVAISGNIGIGTTVPAASLHLPAGTTSLAPMLLTPGSNLTNAVAGTIEYDGTVFYGTADTRSGRGYFPTVQIVRLAADRSAIGPAIDSFFGANTSVNMKAGGIYELEAFLYFQKSASSTVTITLTTSVAVEELNAVIDYGNVSGGGIGSRVALYKSKTTDNALTTQISLTTPGNHIFYIRAMIEANTSSASTLTINITTASGTSTPIRGSYYMITQLPSANTGVFT